jgi:hypothetical protein
MESSQSEAYDMIWYPDTCDCIITYTFDLKKAKALKRCLLHKDVPDDQIFSTVLAHNQSFNLKIFDPIDKVRDAKLRDEAKMAEKLRSMGAQTLK